MIAMAVTMVSMAVMVAAADNGDVEIGFFAPMMVDLLAWYVIGAYLGVLPSL